eukprot:Hpha_TRINITY_DN29718_c0_g1::TRINITY_DN29718_c0_g1_i1::g.2520::m.2520
MTKRPGQPRPNPWTGLLLLVLAVPIRGLLFAPPYDSKRVMVVDEYKGTTSYDIDVSGQAVYQKQWVGIAAANNGKLYAAPMDSEKILVIDTSNFTFSFIKLTNPQIFQKSKWKGIAAAVNGKLYACPYKSNNVLVIDPSNGTTYEFVTKYASLPKWWGIAAASNGKLYCPPANDNRALVIDPSNDAISYITTTSGQYQWAGIVAADNGFMYAAPYNSVDVLVLDPMADKVKKYIRVGATVKTGLKRWIGIAKAPNGKLYAAPHDEMAVLVVTPSTDTLSMIVCDSCMEGNSQRWQGIVVGVDGRLYASPYKQDRILVIEPSTHDLSFINVSAEGGPFGTVRWSSIISVDVPGPPSMTPSNSPTAPTTPPIPSPSGSPFVVRACGGRRVAPTGGVLSTELAPQGRTDIECNATACFNGKTSGCVGSCCGMVSDYCSSDESGVQQWLRLDLPEAHGVGCVGVYNRFDCCEDRLGVHQIRVGNDSSTPLANPICSAFNGNTSGLSYIPHMITSTCEGKYVFVYLPPSGTTGDPRILNLAEVEVWVDTTAPSLAPSPPPSRSPTVHPSTPGDTSPPSVAPVTAVPTVAPSIPPTTPPRVSSA